MTTCIKYGQKNAKTTSERLINLCVIYFKMIITILDILEISLAILLPPAAVLAVKGCGADFCINLGLTILGYIPGIIHAFYVLYLNHQEREREFLDPGRVQVPYNQIPPPYSPSIPVSTGSSTHQGKVV